MAEKRRKAKNKSAYGQGSVYFDKANGVWVAQVRRCNNHTIRRSSACRETAEAYRKELIRQRDAAVDVTAVQQSLAAFIEVWFQRDVYPRHEHGELKVTTVTYYQQICEYYILPALGSTRLADITAGMLIDLKNELMQSVSAQTTQHVLRVLKQILSRAAEWYRMDYNPALVVRPPKIQRRKIVPLTIVEVCTLLKAAAHDPFAVCYWFLVVFGLRIGEVLGLRWSDVDWQAGIITIAQQVLYANGEVYIESSTKTRSGTRVLPVPPRLLAYLRAHQTAQFTERLRNTSWHNYDLIFPASNGQPKGRNNLRVAFLKICARAGIQAHFHLLRHTAATRLDEVGATETVRAAILGHSARTITAQYTHAELERMRVALTAVERLYISVSNSIEIAS
jgi:integrase